MDKFQCEKIAKAALFLGSPASNINSEYFDPDYKKAKAVLRILQDNKPHTAEEIAILTGETSSTCLEILYSLQRGGINFAHTGTKTPWQLEIPKYHQPLPELSSWQQASCQYADSSQTLEQFFQACWDFQNSSAYSVSE